MKKIITLTAVLSFFVLGLFINFNALTAEEQKKLTTDEVSNYITRAKAPEGHALKEILSGWLFRKPSTQALQLDDFQNTGMLAAETGEALWNKIDGKAGKSCASCHGDAGKAMATAGASYPKWNKALGKPVNLEQQINFCRENAMQAAPFKYESSELLGLTTYVKMQSRGKPVNVKVDGDMKAWFEKGKALYHKRFGQLDLACANCHQNYYGKYIRADRLSQGQSNGFPTYRLKWQSIGSLHRRMKGCMKQVRAKPFQLGSDEFLAIETYLAWRGQGLSVETPSVRQ